MVGSESGFGSGSGSAILDLLQAPSLCLLVCLSVSLSSLVLCFLPSQKASGGMGRGLSSPAVHEERSAFGARATPREERKERGIAHSFLAASPWAKVACTVHM